MKDRITEKLVEWLIRYGVLKPVRVRTGDGRRAGRG